MLTPRRAAKTDDLDRGRVGVVLGNICLPTDRANDLCRAVLGGELGLPQGAPHPLNRYVAGLPAGLLAKGLGLGGGSVARPHLENWLDAVASHGGVNAPIEAGHRTATVCHLANIARELNRPLRWDPTRGPFVDDEEADRRLERPRRPGFELPTP